MEAMAAMTSSAAQLGIFPGSEIHRLRLQSGSSSSSRAFCDLNSNSNSKSLFLWAAPDHLRCPLHRCAASGAASTMPHSLSSSQNPVTKKHDYYSVGDFMTPKKELLCALATTTVDEALEMLVENRVTGLPVVDEDNKLVGVVSDYDLLALDSISGKRPSTNSVFPEAGSTWKAFKEIQHLLTKTHGKTVGDVMTVSPLVVRADMNIEDAARILLDTKYRRLPVVDADMKLVGLITRGNVVRAALQVKRAADGRESS